MSLYSQFETDADIERAGIELIYNMGAGKPPVVIRIARAGGGNTRYQRVLDVKTKPYRRQLATETIEPSTLDTIMREVYAEAVVLGWSNVTDKNDEPMEFSKANVVKLFTDLPDLFSDVQSQAQKVALFRKQVLDASAGN